MAAIPVQFKAEGQHFEATEKNPNPERLVHFSDTDVENPKNWSSWQKFRCLAIAYSITFASTFNASSQGQTSAGFRKDHPSDTINAEVYITTTFAFQLMLGVAPLVLSPISETFGRRPMLVVLTALIVILFLPQALAPNFASILATRFFQGACASVEGPVIAGITADLLDKKDRGRAMAVFVLCVYAGNGLGPTISGWIAYKVNWHWVYWLQMCVCGAVCIAVFFFFPETRDETILKKRAEKLTKETGHQHFVRGSLRPRTWFEAVKVSSTRPLKFLFTEPIVMACSLWIGFAFGITFLFIGVLASIFKENYGWNSGEGASVLACGFVGGVIGLVINDVIQLPLYERARIKNGGRADPEARLYCATVAGLLVVVGCFGFAWTARPWIFWFVPLVFVTLLQIGLYTIYLATYNYITDTYERYSSSGQAAQSLLRGIFGATFGFFATPMYHNLTPKWASSLIGFIFAVFALIPFILIPYGPRLRANSHVASAIWNAESKAMAAKMDPLEAEAQVIASPV